MDWQHLLVPAASRFLTCRSVAYLLGDDDTLNNAHLDQSCAVHAQVCVLQSS